MRIREATIAPTTPERSRARAAFRRAPLVPATGQHMEPQATQMRPSWNPIARILAILALVAAVIVLLVVISGSIGGSGGGAGSGHRASRASQSKPKRKYYVVQPGDTFGGIAEKEGVPIARLEKLNPNLDTQLLPQKGCVNLVPEGCKVLANGG